MMRCTRHNYVKSEISVTQSNEFITLKFIYIYINIHVDSSAFSALFSSQ